MALPGLPQLEGRDAVKRRQIVITIAGVAIFIAVILLGLWVSDPNRKADSSASGADPRSDHIRNYGRPSSSIDPMDVWISMSESELRSLRQENEALGRQLEEIRARMDRDARRSGSVDRIPPPERPSATTPPSPPGAEATRPPMPPAPGAPTSPPSAGRPPPPPPPGARAAAPGQPTVPQILSVSFGPATSGDAEVPASPQTVENTLPVSFVRATLLSGLDAPTGGLARTNPHPVLMKLDDNAWLPNRYRSRIKECFVTGEGYGDLSAERAYIRLNLISCVLHSDEVMELTAKGYVSGEDGKTGLRGRVVSKQGALIARALFAGIAGGIGQAIAQSYRQVATNPLGTVETVPGSDIARFGVAQGTASALDRIADYYIDRANELYPIIEIDTGRKVDVVFNERIALGDAFERTQRMHRDLELEGYP